MNRVQAFIRFPELPAVVLSLVPEQACTIHLSQPIPNCHQHEIWSKKTRAQ